MGAQCCFGAVVKWTGFKFDDGDVSDKLLVILGAKPNSPIIAALTTSKPRGRPTDAGCKSAYEAGSYYFAKGGMMGSFKLDTWIELYRPQEIDPVEYLKQEAEKKAWVVFNLRQDFAAGIRNCFKLSPDTSEHHLSLLQ